MITFDGRPYNTCHIDIPEIYIIDKDHFKSMIVNN